MLSALVLVALHAAPLDVVVVDAPNPAGATLKKALKGRTVIDASALYAYLFASGPMPMQDFGAFQAAPVAGWPKPLAATWKDGVAHCRGIAGPAPWKDNAPAVFACANRLSAFLWEQYLAHVHADRVVVLTGGVDRAKDEALASAVVYAPGDEATRTSRQGGVAARWAALVDDVVKAALAGEGAPGRREVVLRFVDEAALDPLTGEAAVTSAVKLKTSCDALPKVLRVTTPGPLGDSVAARWAASTSGTGAARDCSLKLTTHDEELMGASTTVVSAVLQCGEVTASAESTKQKLGARAPVDILSERLVVELAARLCAKK